MPSEFLSHWTLDPQAAFLNHGSFGACPRVVLEYQQDLVARMEHQPVQWFVREAIELLEAARHDVARFVGANPDQLAFVSNATSGVNAVLRSWEFAPGDQLLVTDHEYNASRNVLEYVAKRAGAEVVTVPVPFPTSGPDEALAALRAARTPRTKLLLIDHITSATGMLMPIQEIVRDFEEAGVPVLVDGAHALGMVDLNLDALGASFYTSNAHKWLCAPKGAAILHVRQDHLATVRPHVISHGANMPTDRRTRFRQEFDWIGTDDPSPWLCLPNCIAFLEGLMPGGSDAVRRYNHDLVVRGRQLLLSALKSEAPCPETMLGSMAAVQLPDGEPGEPAALYVDPLQSRLWNDFRVEVPIGPWPAPPRRILRISAQAYNSLEDYEALVAALRRLGVLAEATS